MYLLSAILPFDNWSMTLQPATFIWLQFLNLQPIDASLISKKPLKTSSELNFSISRSLTPGESIISILSLTYKDETEVVWTPLALLSSLVFRFIPNNFDEIVDFPDPDFPTKIVVLSSR